MEIIKSNIYQDFEMTILKGFELLSHDIIEQLKNTTFNIFHNDLKSNLWAFDFKIDDVWFTFITIDNDLTKADMRCFK